MRLLKAHYLTTNVWWRSLIRQIPRRRVTFIFKYAVPYYHPLFTDINQETAVGPSFKADQITRMFTRCISRSILRQASVRLINAQGVNHMTRCFGAAAPQKSCVESSTEVENEDMIRDYIKGLMEKHQQDEVVLKPIGDEDLQKRLDHFQVSIFCVPCWNLYPLTRRSKGAPKLIFCLPKFGRKCRFLFTHGYIPAFSSLFRHF